MNISEHNKKVAISRWEKKHAKEKSMIRNDVQALLLKASICGFLAGDGSVQKRKEKNNFHYQLDFFPDNCLTRDTYIKQIKAVYKKAPSVRKKNNFYAVRLASKIVVEDITEIASFGVKKWSPQKFYSL
jgi:6-phosphogluconate dehydrogenase